MANEFIARKGLIALEDSQITGSLNISSTLKIPGFSDVSASLAAAVAGGDNLGNHTATQDLNMGGNAIISVGNVDGVDVSALNTSVSTNTTNITTLTAATSSYLTSVSDGTLSGSAQIAAEISGAFTAASSSFSTRVTANDAKLTANTSNVTSAGALMDSELSEIATVKALTKAGISGSFTAASASFSTRVTANDAKVSYTDAAVTSVINAANILSSSAQIAPDISGSFTAASASFSTRVTANDAKLTANTSNVTSAGALMDSELAEIATVKALTKAGISGSFTVASSSFSTRVTANDAKLTANTSNVRTAGALMDDELADLAAVKAINQGLTTTSNVVFNHITSSGNISSSGDIVGNRLVIGGTQFADLHSSGFRLGNATKDLNIFGNTLNITSNITASGDISSSGTIVGSNLSGTNTGDQDLSSYIQASQTSSFSTATGVEDNADVTDTSNVTAAGALMDSELAEIATVKALTKAGISGSFNAASASFSTRVTANDAKLTANASNVQSAGALMDSELAEIATVKALTAAGISGSFTAASASLAADIATNTGNIGTTTNALTVDNATLQLNTGTTFNGSAARTISIKDGGVDSDALAADIEVTTLTATKIITTQFTSSFITSSTIVTEGSNIFGDTSADTHTFNGDITASGQISSSGTVIASAIVSSGDIHLSTNNTQITQVLSTGAKRDLIGFDGDNNTVVGNPTANKIKLEGNVTASGNISSSGFISASAFVGDGSGLTGLSAAAITTYNNSGDNRILTSVNSTTVNSEANLTFDGSGLSVTGHITASGNISASGKIITSELSALGDLIIDADGADVLLKDGGTEFGRFKRDNSDFIIKSATNNKDIVFRGVDDSATITALTLDMSDAGKAFFTSDISASGIESSGDIHLSTSNTQITQKLSGGATRDLIGFDGNDNAVVGNPTANKIKLEGNVTASNDISASGTITGNSIVGTLATAAQTNITSVGTLGSLTMGGDIDTDGNNINVNSGEVNSATSIDSNVFKMGNGSVSTPSLAFTNDTNTGLYAIAVDTLGIAAGGQNKVSIGSTSTAFNNNTVSISAADSDGAVLSVTNTYASINPTEAIAIKGVGCTATGTPGSSGPQSYGGYFLAGDTNGSNPDTVALYAQGHEDGAPNSYAAIFSGSAGGVVGINTTEPTVELDIVGTLAATKTKLAKTTTDVANHNGEVVFFGGTTSMDNGKIYYYNASGGWTIANADALADSKGLLAVALGDDSDTDGMLIRGMVTLDHDPGAVADVLYLSTTDGQASSTAPSSNNHVVRVLGYCLDASNGQIYFNPSNDFIVITA